MTRNNIEACPRMMYGRCFFYYDHTSHPEYQRRRAKVVIAGRYYRLIDRFWFTKVIFIATAPYRKVERLYRFQLPTLRSIAAERLSLQRTPVCIPSYIGIQTLIYLNGLHGRALSILLENIRKLFFRQLLSVFVAWTVDGNVLIRLSVLIFIYFQMMQFQMSYMINRWWEKRSTWKMCEYFFYVFEDG